MVIIMENRIKLSVIIPVYNVEKYLKECIESVLKQTLDSIEIIAVNDGSTDKSLDILRDYEKRYNNVKVINQENLGISYSRNVGIKYANGKYIYFLDSDDYIDSNLAEICYYECENNKVQMAIFDAVVLYEEDLNNHKIKFDYNRKEILKSSIKSGQQLFCELIKTRGYRSPVSLAFFNRKFLLDNKLEFFNGIIHEDELFMPQALIAAENVLYIPKDLYFRRIRNNSIMTSKKSIKNIEGYYTVAQELYKFIEQNKKQMSKLTYKLLIKKITHFYFISFKDSYIISKNNKNNSLLKDKIKQSILEKAHINNLKLKLFIMFPDTLYRLSQIKKCICFNLTRLW